MITVHLILEGLCILKKIQYSGSSRGGGERRSKIITIIFIRGDPVVQSARRSARGFHRHPVGCR